MRLPGPVAVTAVPSHLTSFVPVTAIAAGASRRKPRQRACYRYASIGRRYGSRRIDPDQSLRASRRVTSPDSLVEYSSGSPAMSDFCYGWPVYNRIFRQAELMDRMMEHVGANRSVAVRLDDLAGRRPIPLPRIKGFDGGTQAACGRPSDWPRRSRSQSASNFNRIGVRTFIQSGAPLRYKCSNTPVAGGTSHNALLQNVFSAKQLNRPLVRLDAVNDRREPSLTRRRVTFLQAPQSLLARNTPTASAATPPTQGCSYRRSAARSARSCWRCATRRL